MKISVIVPVHNGGGSLGRCLDALAESSRRPDEVIVVDDASTDDTAAQAQRRGWHALSLSDGVHGPAAARNRGAGRAQGDVLVFLDADVAVHADALQRIEDHFERNADVAALFGSYDDDPPDRGLVSRYKNLLHHHTHQRSRREGSTFWAGCGAVRRDVFAALGGFDESYRQPSIEDIELGVRLKRAGYRVWSCPEVQAAHLKRWTLASLVRTDIWRRAVPWTRLIGRSGSLPDDLNLDTASRLSALAAWSMFAALAAGVGWPWALLALVPALAVFIACNADFLRLLHRRGGTAFALAAAGLHLLYYLYSSLTFVVIIAVTALARGRESLADPMRAAARRGLTRQLLTVCAAWLLVWVPHAGNDGLWYQGDSPRHAATGLFYQYALINFSVHPLAYAKTFAGRYPIIAPQTYPPAFHLAEAAAFALLGPSPYVGKALVLLCALLAALYVLAWLRRWVAVEVGELAALLLLVPGVLLWSNVIMLNVPSFAFLLASLYHTRRWLEGADRQVYPAAAWGLVALLTYPQSGVLVFVGGAWLVALRRWELLWSPRTVLLALACALAILPWAVIIAVYSPHLAIWAVPPPTTFMPHRKYLYYLLHAPETYGWFLLALAAVGSVAGLWGRDTRREARLLLIWLVVTYAVFSLVRGKDARYAISLAAPLVLLAALAVLGAGRAIARLSGRDIAGPFVSVLSLAVLAIQAVAAWDLPVQEARGFREVARYLREVAPRDRVIYDGYQFGVFGYYALIDDPSFQRGLIDYGHLFYEAGLSDLGRKARRPIAPATVVTLLEEADCRWVAIEDGPRSPQFEVGHALRDALQGGRFELIRSFPVSGEGASRVDVYRLTAPRTRRPATTAQLR